MFQRKIEEGLTGISGKYIGGFSFLFGVKK